MMPSSKGSSQSGDQTHVFFISSLASEFFTTSQNYQSRFSFFPPTRIQLLVDTGICSVQPCSEAVRGVSPKLSSLTPVNSPTSRSLPGRPEGQGKPTSGLSVDTQAKLHALEHLRALTAVLLSPVPTAGSPDSQLCALLGLGGHWDGPAWSSSARETSKGGPWKQRDEAGRAV